MVFVNSVKMREFSAEYSSIKRRSSYYTWVFTPPCHSIIDMRYAIADMALHLFRSNKEAAKHTVGMLFGVFLPSFFALFLAFVLVTASFKTLYKMGDLSFSSLSK